MDDYIKRAADDGHLLCRAILHENSMQRENGMRAIKPESKTKRLIAKTEIAANKQCGEDRLKEMKDEPGYVFGYIAGFINSDDFSVVGLYDYGNTPTGDHREVFIHA